MNEALPTLLFPFERGLLDAPAKGQRFLVLGASAGFQMPSDSEADVLIIQDFRADYLGLTRAGFTVALQPEGEGYDGALIVLGRHRRENERFLAEALTRVKPGGLIAAAGTKKDGAASVAKRMAEIVTIADQAAKHHGNVFWFYRPEVMDRVAIAGLMPVDGVTPEGLETATGGFSEGRVDIGSQLLLKHLPDKLTASTGRVADFCAGWGFIALELAKKYEMGSLDLYEAHARSLEAAKHNFARAAPRMPTSFHWHDLAAEPVVGKYDAVVMNPPFHQTRSAEPDIGKSMIKAASAALKPGGRLFLVANRGLAYEMVIKDLFKAHGELARDGVFKVLWAKK